MKMNLPSKTSRKIERAKKRWIKACDKWFDLLWCTDYYVTYQFGKVGTTDADGWIAIANVNTESRYKDTLITADLEEIVGLDDKMLDRHACHEVMHVLLSQYQDFAKDLIDWIPGRGRKEVFRAFERDEIESLTTQLVQVVRKIRRDAPCCHTHNDKKDKKSTTKTSKKRNG